MTLKEIWEKLDGACEAIEWLEEHGVSTNIDFSALTGLKQTVEKIMERGKIQ